MKNPKILMIIASIIGALAGVAFTKAVNPENNYYYFMGIFMMIGIIFGNLVLLLIYEIL